MRYESKLETFRKWITTVGIPLLIALSTWYGHHERQRNHEEMKAQIKEIRK